MPIGYDYGGRIAGTSGGAGGGLMPEKPIKGFTEATLQWSRSLPDGVIIVVRGDEITQFMLDVEAVKVQFGLKPLGQQVKENIDKAQQVYDELTTAQPTTLQGGSGNPTPAWNRGEVTVTMPTREPVERGTSHYCEIHQAPLILGHSKTKFTKEGNPKPYYYHIDQDNKMCFGEKK